MGIENVRVWALPCGGSGTTGAGRPLPRDAAPCHANGHPEAVTGRRFFVMRTSCCYGDPNGDKVRVSCFVKTQEAVLPMRTARGHRLRGQYAAQPRHSRPMPRRKAATGRRVRGAGRGF